MTKLIAVLISVLAVALFAPVAQAQSTDDDAISRMPQALFDMIDSSYRCQALTGAEFYANAKETVTNITLKMADGDQDLTTRFVEAAEASAKAKCADTGTCWRSYLGAGASITAEEGEPLCEQKILDAMGVVGDLLEEIIAAQS